MGKTIPPLQLLLGTRKYIVHACLQKHAYISLLQLFSAPHHCHNIWCLLKMYIFTKKIFTITNMTAKCAGSPYCCSQKAKLQQNQRETNTRAYTYTVYLHPNAVTFTMCFAPICKKVQTLHKVILKIQLCHTRNLITDSRIVYTPEHE